MKHRKAESKKVVVTLYVDETETNALTTTVTTTIDDSAFVAVNESGFKSFRANCTGSCSASCTVSCAVVRLAYWRGR